MFQKQLMRNEVKTKKSAV